MPKTVQDVLVGQKAALSVELNTFDFRKNLMLIPVLLLLLLSLFNMPGLPLGISNLADSKRTISA